MVPIKTLIDRYKQIALKVSILIVLKREKLKC